MKWKHTGLADKCQYCGRTIKRAYWDHVASCKVRVAQIQAGAKPRKEQDAK